ncbi:hypothetical protein [Kribbella sp. NPDC004875]|uniref:hypothetical protein n=1 Tax=Kribbella sp. NPDC004875 TaxID=3364107 RepID=UPI0036A95E0D
MQRPGVRRSVARALVTLALLVVLAACSDNSTSGQASPSATTSATATGSASEACASARALKSSLDDLSNVKPLQDGLTALNAAIAAVKNNLAAATAAVSAALQPSVESVKTAFTGLESAASGLTTDTLKQKAPQITAALRQVGTATSSFATAVTQICPGQG